MITDSFDYKTPAKINPRRNPDAPAVDACIMTFSYLIKQFVRENRPCRQIAQMQSVTGVTPIYAFAHRGKTFAFSRRLLARPPVSRPSRIRSLRSIPTNISCLVAAAVWTRKLPAAR